jgi:hypothetical protein
MRSTREVWNITLGVLVNRAGFLVRFTALAEQLHRYDTTRLPVTATTSSIFIFQLYKLYVLGRKWLNDAVIVSVKSLLSFSSTYRLIRARKPHRRRRRRPCTSTFNRQNFLKQ